ncbi:MAG: hypothetical protein ACSHWS_07115 [Sulfitobacter sp.]
MITCYFLDWIEPPVAPWSDAAVREFNVTFSGYPKKYQKRFPSSARVWLRSDGFFLFSLNFAQTDKEIAKKSVGFDPFAIEIAGYASEFIRDGIIENRSVVGYDPSLRYSFRTIMVNPIKISKVQMNLDPEDILTSFKDDTFLRNIPAKIRENENGFFTSEDTVPAILLLRRHFGRCYDKALMIRQQFKNRKLRVPVWFKRSEDGWQFRTWKFDYYGIKHIIVGWLLWSVYIMSRAARTAPIDDPGVKDSIERLLFGFSEATFWLLGLGIFPAVVIAWFLVIHEKRRKTLMAYDKAIGVLQTGNYYHAILQRVMTSGVPRAKASAGEIPTNFSLLITRLQEFKRIEIEKQQGNKRWFLRIGVFGALAFGTVINLPDALLLVLQSENVKEWLDVFTLAPTRRN